MYGTLQLFVRSFEPEREKNLKTHRELVGDVDEARAYLREKKFKGQFQFVILHTFHDSASYRLKSKDGGD